MFQSGMVCVMVEISTSLSSPVSVAAYFLTNTKSDKTKSSLCGQIECLLEVTCDQQLSVLSYCTSRFLSRPK